MTIVDGQKKFECSLCSKTLTTKRRMITHVDVDYKELKKNQFRKLHSIKKQKIVKVVKKGFQCKKCDKTYDSKQDFRAHRSLKLYKKYECYSYVIAGRF